MAVVADFGTFVTKVGFSTDAVPSFVERSVALQYNSMGAPRIAFGDEGLAACSLHATDPSSAHIVPSLWTPSSLISSSSRELLFRHVLHLYDRLFSCRGGSQDLPSLLSAHPLNAVIPEGWFSDRKVLEAVVETFLGYAYGSRDSSVCGPAIYLSRPSVSSALGAGKPSALVLDVGHAQVTATAVCDGYALGSSVRSVAAGGAALNNSLLALKPVHPQTGVRAPCVLASMCGVSQGPWGPILTDQAASDFRVYGGASLRTSHLGDRSKETAPVALPFQLPDGNHALLPEDDVCAVLEHGLFGGSKLCAHPAAHDGTGPGCNVAKLLVDCKSRVDPQIRQSLPVVVCGGVSQTRGFAERFAQELRLLDSSITALYNPTLPLPAGTIYNLQWSGAALVAQSSAFAGLWISSSEYEEAGSSVLTRKLFL